MKGWWCCRGGDRRQRRQWRHEGATVPLAPSHASSRAGRAPASMSGGVRRAASEGRQSTAVMDWNPSLRRCSAWPSEKDVGKSKWWRGRFASAGPLWPTAATGVVRARRSQNWRRQGHRGRAEARGGRWGRGHRSIWRIGWSDLSGLAKTSGPTRPEWASQAKWALAYLAS
jgi:hypothetical protein